MEARFNRVEAFEEFVRTVKQLRGPGGCPWDREQTHRSLRAYVIEEAYEVVSAINNGDAQNLCEELGDLLLQVVLHSVIAEEEGAFDLKRVIESITEKIVRRHPHVFSAMNIEGVEGVRQAWEDIKREEKGEKLDLLAAVDVSLPALLEAEKLQAKAAVVGFDWPSPEEAWPKVEEELAELHEAWAGGARAKIEEEMGDVLFSLVNIARLLGINPEIALKMTNNKFRRRFQVMEGLIRSKGKEMKDLTLEELDEFWSLAKREEGGKSDT